MGPSAAAGMSASGWGRVTAVAALTTECIVGELSFVSLRGREWIVGVARVNLSGKTKTTRMDATGDRGEIICVFFFFVEARRGEGARERSPRAPA